MRHPLIALLASALVGGLVPAAAGAAGSLPPVALSPATATGSADCEFLFAHPGIAGVDVAANARGDTMVSWTQNAGAGAQVVKASFRPAGGSFGTPQTIGPTLPCYLLLFGGSTPDVALDAAGGAAIVFAAPGTGSRTVTRAAIRPPGGSFGTPVDLSNDAIAAEPDARLAMNAAGAAVATWSRTDAAGDRIIQVASRAPGQPFIAAGDLSAPLQDADIPRVAINDAGTAAVTWMRSDGAHTIAQARVRPAGQAAFAAVQNLSVAGQDAKAPDVALAPSGITTVAWSRTDGTQARVQSRFLTPAGTIGSGVDDVSDPGVDGTPPNLAVAPDNTAMVVFGACPTAGGACAVQAAARPSNGSFGAVQGISAPTDQFVAPKVTIDPAGVATAVFSPFADDGPVLLTRRPAGGTFGGVTPISPAGTTLAPSLASDDEGNVLVGWSSLASSGANPWTAQVSAFDAGAPALAVGVPGNGTTGVGVSVTATAADRWSPVSLGWDFGDGTSGSGGAVSHTFGSPGAFRVTATATDAAGNATTATRSLLISPPPPAPPTPPTLSIDTPVQTLWGVAGKQLFLLRLKATRVPRGTKVALRCKGERCPKDRSSTTRRLGGITLFKGLSAKKSARSKARSFRAGQRLDVRVTAPGRIGKVVRFKLAKGKIPKGKVLCLPPGKRAPQQRC